ncbi:MAG: hypothetical protein H7235_11360 [Bdellovibrionaceae bacterium]|nr:hypothetical protein [Pseudobdellovibrionaceae bacterium]
MRINTNLLKLLFCTLMFIDCLSTSAQEFSPRAAEMLRQSVENETTPSLRFLNASIFTTTTNISGSDDLSNSIDIGSRQSLGLKIGYTYQEEFITARAELGYRNIIFSNEANSSIPIEKNYTNHDIGLSYYIIHQTWEKVKLVAGVKYQSLYYFQSEVGQSYIKIISEFEAVPSVGVEWLPGRIPSSSLAVYALMGVSLPNADVKPGLSTQFGIKFNHVYSPHYTILSDFSYSKIQNRTDVTQFTTASKQSRSELNLQFGLQREY